MVQGHLAKQDLEQRCPYYWRLGAQLVLAKRIVPPTPFPAISVRDPGRPPPRDLDAEAVMNVPLTPDSPRQVLRRETQQDTQFQKVHP